VSQYQKNISHQFKLFNDEKEGSMSNGCHIQWRGLIEYGQALELQKELVSKRVADEIPDTLLLVEHPQTYTIGVDGHREHLLIGGQEMAQLGIAYHQVNRGGAIFYHCPGQLVVYPILKLNGKSFNYHDYVKKLESVVIRSLSYFKIRAFRQPNQGGIWVFSGHLAHDRGYIDDAVAKIGGVGVKVNQNGFTSHGFWLNVNPSLQLFDFIVPGGIKDCHTTSLQYILNSPLEVNTVIEPVVQAFCQIFEMEPLTLNMPVATNQDLAWNIPL
jgi:lipoyl(octanoyl) transferase